MIFKFYYTDGSTREVALDSDTAARDFAYLEGDHCTGFILLSKKQELPDTNNN